MGSLIINTLKDIIIKKAFSKELAKINKNFFNLKQELFIRNALVVQYNSICKKNERAVAEHPKYSYGAAVDLALLNNNKVQNRIEFKYQYPRGLRCSEVHKELLKDTNYPKSTSSDYCTDFILVIHERSEKINSFSDAGISPIYINWNDKFTSDYNGLLEFEKKINREFIKETISIKCKKPYKNTYHFIFYNFCKNA